MKKERKMKKVLFPILALVLALGLALPMAAVVGAAPDTATFGDDPLDWEKTENRLVDDTADGVGDAPAWTESAWGDWVSPAWDGPSKGIYDDDISYWVENDTWVKWSHAGDDWDEHTDQWFRTTVNIPATWVVTAVELLYKYNEAIIPINDDLYVYVDDEYVAAGGTAGVLAVQGSIGGAPPNPTYGSNTFVAAVDPYSFAVAPETGWYLDGGLDLPPELFTPGSHEIHVLGEEFDISGGLGHLVIKVEYEEAANPEVTITKSADKDWVMHGDSITYTYNVENTGDVDLAPPSVTDSLGITVNPVLDGNTYNIGDTGDDGVFGVGEIWVFTASYTVPVHSGSEVDPIVDTATATAYLETAPITDDSDQVSVDIVHPSIEVTKSADKDWVMHGDSITYTYEVENTGDVDLAPPSVTDTLGITVNPVLDGNTYNIGDTGDDGVFGVGEIWVFTASYTVPVHSGSEVDPIVDTATATAYLETAPITDDSDQVSVDIIHLTDLTPPEAYNLVGDEHTVYAALDYAVAGVPITFEVTGANPQGPTPINTNASGVAAFTYTGVNPGEDTITATFGDVTLDVTKYWFFENFLTGGGTIKDGKKPAWNISGNVGYLPDGTIVGNFNIVDHHLDKNHYKCHNAFTSLVFSGDPTTSPPTEEYNNATFTGTFTDKDGNPHVLTIIIEDNGEPGKGVDKISVYDEDGSTFWVQDGTSSNPVIIDGGNYQVHDGFKG